MYGLQRMRLYSHLRIFMDQRSSARVQKSDTVHLSVVMRLWVKVQLSVIQLSLKMSYFSTPHYNYVGDSILGFKAHMGAGSITSNVKSDKKLVVVHTGEGNIETGLKKFGAMLGDCVEVGCNSVLNPGTVLGPNVNVYPTSSVRGYVPAAHIFKTQDQIVKKEA